MLEAEVEASQSSMRLYAKLLDMQNYKAQNNVDVTTAVTIFQKALESKLSAEEKAGQFLCYSPSSMRVWLNN